MLTEIISFLHAFKLSGNEQLNIRNVLSRFFLLRGECGILIKDVTPADKGTWTCRYRSWVILSNLCDLV